jgi:Tol biopolymer transport system component
MAQPFDSSRLTLTGDASPIAEGVNVQPTRAGTYSVAETGALVYQTGESVAQLGLLDREGKRVQTLGERSAGYQDYSDIQFSPDGTRAAMSFVPRTGDNPDIWIFDMARNIPMRLTSDPAIDGRPIWSPDGAHIVFQSNRKNGINDLYERASGGAGSEGVLLADSVAKNATSWSADGRFILYSTGGAPAIDIWVLPLEGDRKPFPFLQTRFNESDGQFSPDGRWVAFTSDESGESEVYVAPFLGPGAKWRISTSGGRFPRWRRDGRELFFEVRGTLMAAAVSSDRSAFDVGAVRMLFGGVGGGGSQRRKWDVAPDGQRFLVGLQNTDSEIVPITLVVNWMAALKN